MGIPVRNIYYLLLYAWGHFKSGSVKELGADDSPDLPNLFASVLNEGTHRLMRRGLDRGYVEVTEETRSPRGKLRLDLMTKQQTMLRGFAVCDVDELTPDVLHNQVLKASLIALASCANVKKELRHQLELSAKRMAEVSNIRISADLFARIQLSRNTSQYGLLMRVCELVFYSLIPDSEGKGTKFQDILEDELRMPALFEEFLRNFYRSELPGYGVAGEMMRWSVEAENEADLAYLPIMQTDVTLRSAERTIVADAKYYKDALSGGRKTAKVRSDHLYQLTTYLSHVREREPHKAVNGLLIYPAVNSTLRLNYRLLGTPITIATVDLSAEWPEIHNELIELVDPVAAENAPANLESV